MKIPAQFSLDTTAAYQYWRDQKLSEFPQHLDQLCVKIEDPKLLTTAERSALHDRCRRANMAIYQTSLAGVPDKTIPVSLGIQFGLSHLDQNPFADDDSISALAVSNAVSKQDFIPYTNRALQWHTDGYYNEDTEQIGSFILHCVRKAMDGGENGLVDPEVVYIKLREQNPEYIHALMAKDVITIPAYCNDQGHILRPQRSGPIFSFRSDTQTLQMRYTQRKHNVIWKQDQITQDALTLLNEILNSDDEHIFHYTLQAGEGLICNNVLHNRTAFSDPAEPTHQRLLYRARYTDRMTLR